MPDCSGYSCGPDADDAAKRRDQCRLGLGQPVNQCAKSFLKPLPIDRAVLNRDFALPQELFFELLELRPGRLSIYRRQSRPQALSSLFDSRVESCAELGRTGQRAISTGLSCKRLCK